MLRFERPFGAKTEFNRERHIDGWKMPCPICDDRTNPEGSLWVTINRHDNREERQWWKCFGCGAGFWELRDYADEV